MKKILLFLLEIIVAAGILLFVGEENLIAQSEKGQPPLKLTLLIGEKPCLGKNFEIIADLENISNENVIIDTRHVWRYVTEKSFDQSSSDILKIPRMRTKLGDSLDIEVPKENFITLKPEESFKDSITIKPENDPFYKHIGRYSIETGYGQFKDWSAGGFNLFIGKIDSNELEFRISDCKKISDKN